MSRGLGAGYSLRKIAASLGRSPSTISREVVRHGGLSLKSDQATPEGHTVPANGLGSRVHSCHAHTC
ncbi:helix-turn-helix domain-containing protein [Mycetohabitans sp. B7]|uniref:helix-turn-helix domain-containing protein n=1 Tax=unclassified Mycetohabitans TaxID=2622646 RepID=UPI0009F8B716|nr:helix-turn-helix domain-containing protein [Mycetohabitans sp. B3]MCG1038837.1 helix-turn-helix domain-containing protein [Mycetohabitans sp. B7]